MSVSLWELVSSRGIQESRDDRTFTVKYIAMGSTDSTVIRNAAILDTPRSYWGLYRSAVNVEPRGGNQYWDVDVTYAVISPNEVLGEEPLPPETLDPDAPLPVSYSFQTSGGTTHIQQSRSTTSSTVVGGGAAPNFKQAINVTKEGVEGVDIVTAQAEFTIEARRAFVSLNYFNTLFRLTGTVNNAAWKNFQEGEVLYLGCDARYTSNDGWSLSHKFSAEPNQESLRISADLTVARKYGWDYLWVGYKEGFDAGYRVRTPFAAYCERVYRFTNFAQLEIGV